MPTRHPCSSFNVLTALLSGENFTGFDTRCIKLDIQPYLPPKIEYQYFGEPLREIFSTGGELSYNLEQKKGQCVCTRYRLNIDLYLMSNGRYLTSNTKTFFGRFKQLKEIVVDEGTEFARTVLFIQYHECQNGVETGTLGLVELNRISPGFGNITPNVAHEIKSLTRTDNEPDDCADCTFTVTETFEDGTEIIRHEETRSQCPNVEQFDCNLGEIQTIEAKAKPFEILFISDGYDPNDSVFDAFRSLTDTSRIDAYLRGNPPNCFLIWKLRRQFGISFSLIDIAQICSAENCPPPLVNFECLRCCEKCPQNTCPVECGDHICCYDSEGIAVEIIPIENYCNE